MTHPYSDLPPNAFWRSGVAEETLTPEALYRPKFPLGPDAAIATAGSCFAQHIGRFLHTSGLNLLDVEPPLNDEAPGLARQYGYGIYSARYGNIYTTRQLLQLLEDAASGHVDGDLVWEHQGRFHDALRPAIEPEGFVSVEETLALRRAHLAAVDRLIGQATHLIFTLGLCECWADRQSGRVYPIAPGVIAGEYDAYRHHLLRLGYPDLMDDLIAIRAALHRRNPGLRMILTVSPVPLTATATGQHVLTATTEAKSLLRAVAGAFAEGLEDVDYFPAYEIVMNPAAKGAFFMPNLREVSQEGVDAVMTVFRHAHGIAVAETPDAPSRATPAEELLCEEVLIEALRR
ncbi:GSCFA domain-containing protein [Paracoccus caeni]|uniref:GSCFA domain-containing protein n=1 Tax=Paracoccus caeni TaxID=657651 RepID=A0A934SBX5_9RHOB|nr:GSCFA domain-containing protein [Paracoccus caeni]MBK4214510.1 GSCFA domain-containing protein [Paracoccus caeni]